MKKIIAGVCSLLMLSCVATSVAFAEIGDSLGDSIGTSIGTSDNETPGTSGSDTPGTSGSENPGTSTEYPDLTGAIPSGVVGDANNDGKVNVADLILIRSNILHKAPDTALIKAQSDATGDGKVNVADLINIRAYILHKIANVGDTIQNEPTVGDSD